MLTSPTEWALVQSRRLTAEAIQRLRAAGVQVIENRWLEIFGGQPTGTHTLAWRGPRPAALDPSLCEPGFPRPTGL